MEDVTELIRQWVSLQTRPNNDRKYSRCPVCGHSWWGNNEEHNFTCWVPFIAKVCEYKENCEGNESTIELKHTIKCY